MSKKKSKFLRSLTCDLIPLPSLPPPQHSSLPSSSTKVYSASPRPGPEAVPWLAASPRHSRNHGSLSAGCLWSVGWRGYYQYVPCLIYKDKQVYDWIWLVKGKLCWTLRILKV